jgi:hypothetical protein
MLILDMSAVKLPGEAKQNNLPPKCGQPIDAGARVGYRTDGILICEPSLICQLLDKRNESLN